MPLPKPKPSGQTAEQWMATCMGNPTVQSDFKDHKQRVAVCLNLWREHHGSAATGPAPKAVAVATCQPTDGESEDTFMQRCVASGDSEAACEAAWEMWDSMDGPMPGGGSVSVEGASLSGVQMKWMPTVLEVKGLNEGARTIQGIATTSNVDLVGDVVESMGARYKEPPQVPVLLHHDHRLPVGIVERFDKSEKGIRFQARIAKVEEEGTLKARTDEAWQMLRCGIIKGISIGFTPVPGQTERIKDGRGLRFKEYFLHEISLVSVPANQDATVTVIRSLDEQARGIQRQPPPAQAPVPIVHIPQPVQLVQAVVAKGDPIVDWINDPANAKEWRRLLKEWDGAPPKTTPALEKHAAANIRLRQPKGEISREQIRFEAWELRRYW